MNYYLVIGRAHGDDESSSHPYWCGSAAEAIMLFKADVIHEAETLEQTEVYIDRVWNCGQHRPEVAS